MEIRHRRLVLLALLVMGSLLTAPSPTWGHHGPGCEGHDCSGFAKGEYKVVESAGHVVLDVDVAFCCPMAQGQIDYYTSDLTAVAGQDYKQTSGTLTFSALIGVAPTHIRVPVHQDELVEGEERFEVRLTNFRGSFVSRGRETALVRVLDNEDSKQSSGSSSSPDRSSQQAVQSRRGTSSPPPSEASAGPASSGSTAAGDGLGELNVNEPSEPVVRDEAQPVVGRTERSDKRPSYLLPAALGTLVVVAIAAAELGLKKRVRRRLTPNP